MPASPDLDDISFLGRLSEALSHRIEEQTRAVFDAAAIAVPVRSVSLLTALGAAGEASAADLARALGQSHQLIVQKIPALVRLGLIAERGDPDDARRKLFRPTDEGRAQLAALEACRTRIAEAYRQLSAETGDLHGAIVAALAALDARPLRDRIGD